MSDQADELLQRYADAVAQDERRPSDRVRAAVRAHAHMQRSQPGPAATTTTKPRAHAANQSKWTLSLVASLAMVGLVGLLVIQIEHGSPDDREVAFGGPAPSRPLPTAAPAAAPVATPVAKQAPALARADAAPPPPPAAPAAVAEPAPRTAQRQVVAESRVAQAPVGRVVTEVAQAAPPVPQSADTLSNGPAPRDAKMARADASAGATAHPMPVPAPVPTAPAATAAAMAPPPAAAMEAPPPPAARVIAPPATALAKTAAPPEMAPAPGAQRERNNAPAAAPVAVRFLAAVRSGRLDDMDALLAQGASVNTRDESGNTALMVALGERQVQAARRLLERGADSSLLNHEGVNALQIAVRMDLPELVKLLQQPGR